MVYFLSQYWFLSQALLAAFADACASPTASRITIPAAIYKLGAVKLWGPCKAPELEFQLHGTLIAETEGTKEPAWVSFAYINNLVVSGNGVFDGQGPKAWGRCSAGTYCKQLPMVSSLI